MRRANAGRPVDWGDIRRRLARAVTAAETGAIPAEEARRIMDERARWLATPKAAERAAAGALEVLVFSLGDERYALATSFVRSVARLAELAPVPGAERPLRGVTSLRGEIVALFDLRSLFGVDADGETGGSWIVVCGERSLQFALLADAVHELTSLNPQDILKPAGSPDAAGRQYVHGITADALLLLDGARLLASPQLRIDHSSV